MERICNYRPHFFSLNSFQIQAIGGYHWFNGNLPIQAPMRHQDMVENYFFVSAAIVRRLILDIAIN